ncbi:MAG: glycosyltransferase family 2 protein [Verrucomicrobiota bacterium]
MKTPVVLILFNRPQTTARVFEAVRRAKPEKLFLVADGPRNADEVAKCAAARAVTESIDWPCEVKREFSEVNLGCGTRPATGLTWVFSHVEEAIILEDDCIPSESFFRFCETLLAHYRREERVMHISGNNFQHGRRKQSYSYYFSKYSHNWGWATWKRAWKHFDFELKRWPEFKESEQFKRYCGSKLEQEFWRQTFERVHGGARDIWDYQWQHACWCNGGYSVLPSVNLVSNIGHGADATHTVKRTDALEIPAMELGEIRHPPGIGPDEKADRYTFDTVFGGAELRKQRSLKTRVRLQIHLAKKAVLRKLGVPQK